MQCVTGLGEVRIACRVLSCSVLLVSVKYVSLVMFCHAVCQLHVLLFCSQIVMTVVVAFILEAFIFRIQYRMALKPTETDGN